MWLRKRIMDELLNSAGILLAILFGILGMFYKEISDGFFITLEDQKKVTLEVAKANIESWRPTINSVIHGKVWPLFIPSAILSFIFSPTFLMLIQTIHSLNPAYIDPISSALAIVIIGIYCLTFYLGRLLCIAYIRKIK